MLETSLKQTLPLCQGELQDSKIICMLINLNGRKYILHFNAQVFNINSVRWMRNLKKVCLFKKKTLLLNEPLMTTLNFIPIIFIAIFRGALMLVCRFCLCRTAFSASGCFLKEKKKNSIAGKWYKWWIFQLSLENVYCLLLQSITEHCVD